MSSIVFSYAGCVLSQQTFLFLLLLICCGYPNSNAQGAFVITSFICSDLFNCLESTCTVAIRTKNSLSSIQVIFTKKIFIASSHFHCFDVFPVRPTQKFQVQAKIQRTRPVFPNYLSVSCDYLRRNKSCKNMRNKINPKIDLCETL